MPGDTEAGYVAGELIEKLTQHFAGRAAAEAHYPDSRSVGFGPHYGIVKQDPRAVWRPARTIAVRCQPAFVPAGRRRRDHIQTSAVALGAEHDLVTVRRPVRLP